MLLSEPITAAETSTKLATSSTIPPLSGQRQVETVGRGGAGEKAVSASHLRAIYNHRHHLQGVPNTKTVLHGSPSAALPQSARNDHKQILACTTKYQITHPTEPLTSSGGLPTMSPAVYRTCHPALYYGVKSMLAAHNQATNGNNAIITGWPQKYGRAVQRRYHPKLRRRRSAKEVLFVVGSGNDRYKSGAKWCSRWWNSTQLSVLQCSYHVMPSCHCQWMQSWWLPDKYRAELSSALGQQLT